MCFIVYSKAFDCVSHSTLGDWGFQREISLIKKLYRARKQQYAPTVESQNKSN